MRWRNSCGERPAGPEAQARKWGRQTMKHYAMLALMVLMALTPFLLEHPVSASGITAAAYNLVQNMGTPLVARTTLNCSTGMSCSDDAINKVTVLTAIGSGGSVTSVVCGGTTITTTGTCVTNNQLVRSFGAAFDGGGSALTSGKTTYFTMPFACTITGYNITADAGTVSFDVWKVATGTAIPTVGNSILTGGFLALSSGTALHSTSVTLFTTTAVAAFDIIGVNLQAVATATVVSLVIPCNAT
jgi:hypothetical protein